MKERRGVIAPKADTKLLATTAFITFAAALGVSGGTNVWMILRDHKLIKEHRPTLTFRSAIFGDGILLPVISTLMMKSFVRWKPRIDSRNALFRLRAGARWRLCFMSGRVAGG